MNSSSSVKIPELSMPKGGGALRGMNDAVSVAGATGVAAFSVPLPISAGRGFAPALSLNYNSGSGNGICGIGWSLPLASISLDTSDGVPRYNDTDTVLGPGGQRLTPERDKHDQLIVRTVDKHPRFTFSGTHQVQRFLPQVQGSFDRIERWTPANGGASFWLVQAADGSLHLYGWQPEARIADPAQPTTRIAQWLLQASLAVDGEQIRYEYATDERMPDDGRDRSANRYLKGIRYGNCKASQDISERIEPEDWHFNVVLDYMDSHPLPDPSFEWYDLAAVRKDAFSRYAHGFEVRNRRLCRLVRMYHRFPELGQGNLILVNWTLLEYAEQSGLSCLKGITTTGLDSQDNQDSAPSATFEYSTFDLAAAIEKQRFTPMPGFSGLDTGPYSLVDLQCDGGVPGILLRDDTGWLYRAPERDTTPGVVDGVSYGPWQPLPQSPVGQASSGGNRLLANFSGNGQVDWVVAEPGRPGFFTLNPDKTWSNFIPFAAFPPEFFNKHAQMASLVGGPYQDLVLIGPKSVRLYSGKGAEGFAAALDVEQEPGISLPLSGGLDELVALSDMLGVGQQQLIRIRYDSVTCWPSLGHGVFGKPISIPIEDNCAFDMAASFNPQRIFLADLDGNGAPDLIYAHTDHLAIYRNQSGNGLKKPIKLLFPKDVQFDNLSLLQFADNRGLGCANLILTLPQRAENERHWCFDFTGGVKPYLLTTMDNSQGLRSTIAYRSSAQAWLDDKAAGLSTVCHLPFPVHTVASLTHHDAISGNKLTQSYGYHHGYYDRQEREFRGFGLVEHLDTEQREEVGSVLVKESYLAPVMTRTWYHQGIPTSGTDRSSYCDLDKKAMVMAPTLYVGRDGQPLVEREEDEPSVLALKKTQRIVMARALAGSVLRTEVTGVAQANQLYAVSEARYRVCLLAFHNEDAAVVQPQALESLSYQYDSVPSDPICAQQITLAWDKYGTPLHSVSINYPRRLTKKVEDIPPHLTEEHEKTWWLDSHDPSQQILRLSESRQEWYHLEDPDNWRLGLPKHTRTDMLELSEVGGLKLDGKLWSLDPLFSYERLSVKGPGNPLWEDPQGTRQMTGMQVQHYWNAEDDIGMPTLQGLPHSTEIAELDEMALAVYEERIGRKELDQGLQEAGYHRMKWLMVDERDRKGTLAGIKTDYCTYYKSEGFYRLWQHRLLERIEGGTRVKYDPYLCKVMTTINAVGHTTRAFYDYRTLQPVRIIDLNENTQETVYDGLGRVLATSFYGTETIDIREEPAGENAQWSSHVVEVGFDPLYESAGDTLVSLYRRNEATIDGAVGELAKADASGDPEAMVRAREAVLGNWATAIYYDVHSWSKQRTPVHTATFVADKYPKERDGQVRVSIASLDGLGRAVQTKTKVEQGKAYITDNDQLMIQMDGLPPTRKIAEHAKPVARWLVSGRVEYNNKGLPVRSYQPYFLDTHRYVSDMVFRGIGYSTRVDYDPLGRAIKTVRPDGYFQRQTYWPYYVISEDANDTATERELSEPAVTVH